MKNIILITAAVILMAGCKNTRNTADAYGNFEATEVTVSAETGGRILSIPVSEGMKIRRGEIIAVVDTTLLNLQKGEIDAGIAGTLTRISSINAQNEILIQQIENLMVNIRRIENMLKDDAATQKQYDDLSGQVEVLRKQIAANNTQKTSIQAEVAVLNARKATLLEQIIRCKVKSPTDGTITARFAEEGELVIAGRPMVKIADMSAIKLKVYVSGAQLGKIKTGQECTVRIDNGKKEYTNLKGTITNIAEKAEFTPKIIQTKEERVALVYAVTIELPNDGTIKSGMPGEAIF